MADLFERGKQKGTSTTTTEATTGQQALARLYLRMLASGPYPVPTGLLGQTEQALSQPGAFQRTATTNQVVTPSSPSIFESLSSGAITALVLANLLKGGGTGLLGLGGIGGEAPSTIGSPGGGLPADYSLANPMQQIGMSEAPIDIPSYTGQPDFAGQPSATAQLLNWLPFYGT